MIYNYTKCESVIAKIMADLNISEKNIRITDMREWIFEAVDKIGAPMQYIQKESGIDGEPILKIEDGQVPLPCGLQVLDGAAYSHCMHGPWIHMRSNTAMFKGPQVCHHHGHGFYNHFNNYRGVHCDECHGEFHKPLTRAELYTQNNVRFYEHAMSSQQPEDPTYFIKPGWLVVNKKHGFVKLAYKTIAVDERGYPLIPDLSSYQEAVYWYVVMKLSFPKYLAGKLGGKGVNTAQNTYFYMQQQWNFYRNQAYAECMMPTADQMESIKNDWHKLLPEWDADETFFKSQGKEQINYNDYYYGY